MRLGSVVDYPPNAGWGPSRPLGHGHGRRGSRPLGGGCLPTFPAGLGAAGLWWGLACGLIVTGSLLAWRFFKFTARAAPVRHPFEDKEL